MSIKIRKDLVGGIFFLIFATVIWFIIPSQIVVNTNSTINSQTFPSLLALVMFAASLILIIKDIRRIINKDTTSVITINFADELKPLLVIILLLAYAYGIELIGFLISSVVFSILMLALSKCKKLHYYAIILITSFAIYYIFKSLLLVQLP